MKKLLLILLVGIVLGGCSLFDNDDSTQADEQMINSMSMEEGGTVYTAMISIDISTGSD